MMFLAGFLDLFELRQTGFMNRIYWFLFDNMHERRLIRREMQIIWGRKEKRSQLPELEDFIDEESMDWIIKI